MIAYYNENEPYAAGWLRNLLAAGLIAPGDVDDRSVKDVLSADLDGYAQCHFFAGIGGWSYALRLAGWPDDEPAWTGSCPCQPFSSAGKRAGTTDARHLWPDWFRLIRERRPVTIFGEQVEGAVRLGWLDGVFGDLEGEDYACGVAVLGAHSVGAPHIRQRLWWVADSQCQRPEAGAAPTERTRWDVPWGGGADSRLADSDIGAGGQGRSVGTGRDHRSDAVEGAGPRGGRGLDRMGDAEGIGRRQARRDIACDIAPDGDESRNRTRDAGAAAGFWSDSVLIPCLDGKARRVPVPESGILPLAHGVSGRMGKLRAAGNAIVPQVAAEFVKAFMECRP